jgi:hypothetical protein
MYICTLLDKYNSWFTLGLNRSFSNNESFGEEINTHCMQLKYHC